jgi:hypothetical protein
MKKRALSTIFLILMCVVVASPTFTALVAQPKVTLQQTTVQKIMVSTSTISISGTVYGLPLDGTGAVPVEGAQVVLIGGKIIGGITFAFQKSTPTNANGYYSFSDIPVGIFLVVARKPSEYLPGFRFVRLTPSQPIKQNQDIHMIRIGGSNGSQDMSQYMNTISADEQILLQQYMNTLPVNEQILMQQYMNTISANKQILTQE